MIIETERCVVRDWRPEDAERVFDIYRRWEVARWLGRSPHPMQSRDEADRLVQRWARLNHERPREGRWAVQRKSDRVVAGTVLLVPLPDTDGELEVGWHFHPDSWGQGLASEAAIAVVEWAFDRGVDEIFAVVRPDNTPSIAVCHRMGMTALGRNERYYEAELELFRIRRRDGGAAGGSTSDL